MSDKFPIGLVIGLVTQGAAIVWTVSMMMSDIHRNQEKIIETQQRVGRLETSSQQQAIAIARIDENIKAIRQAVEKMAKD